MRRSNRGGCRCISGRFSLPISTAVSFGVVAVTLLAQQPGQPASKPPPPTPAGVEAPWDARKIVAQVLQDNQQIKPLLTSLNPQDWYDKKGAPSTYILQWQTAQTQLSDVEVTGRLLLARPESLSEGLDVYFRLEALETSTRAVVEGAQRYGDRATADRLSQLTAKNFDSR